MKKIQHLGFAALSTILLFSCGGNQEESVSEAEAPCTYAYDDVSSSLEWVAFKFTNKTPVKGTFTVIEFDGTLEAADPIELLSTLSFTIPVSSVETQNEDRNGKIVENFFGTLSTDDLTGKMVSLSDDGVAVIEVMMNNMAQNVTGTYTFEQNRFSFKATMDVMNWNAGEGIAALNTICKDLHTGDDGVSKLWSEVDLNFSTVLQTDCK
ncbi:MAG: hypothetical protein ACI9XP_000782 [Lentimonas sp.]|jgi:hypothetical protein